MKDFRVKEVYDLISLYNNFIPAATGDIVMRFTDLDENYEHDPYNKEHWNKNICIYLGVLSKAISYKENDSIVYECLLHP